MANPNTDRIMGARAPVEPGTVMAVVDIGSSAIRLIIAEIEAPGKWRPLEVADKPVPLGRDVFVNDTIARDTVNSCLHILNGFRELMDAYEVNVVKAIATSALRETENRDTFLDRIYRSTGIAVNVIEGIDANYLAFMAVQHALRDYRPSLGRTSSLIMEVGGGSTEVMILQRGRMQAAHTLRLGTVRMKQQVRTAFGYGQQVESLLLQDVRKNLELLASEHALQRLKQFIAVGGDARLMARHVGVREGDAPYAVIARQAFNRFIERLQRLTVDEIVRQLQISYDDAEQFLPALLVHRMFFNATAATHLVVPSVSIRDGVLLDSSQGGNERFQHEFRRQVIASARSLGEKFHYDEHHCRHVADLSLQVYDALEDEHQLPPHCRTLLEVTALLHDVGTFINTADHDEHGYYIVANSDLFGINRDDLNIIANIVRYHRTTKPDPVHGPFARLRREERITVLKLTAILRVGDALDRSHSQRVAALQFERSDDEFIVHAQRTGEVALEKMGLAVKSDLFEEVYGLKVVLV